MLQQPVLQAREQVPAVKGALVEVGVLVTYERLPGGDSLNEVQLPVAGHVLVLSTTTMGLP